MPEAKRQLLFVEGRCRAGPQVLEAGSQCRHRSTPVVLLVKLVGADGGFELRKAGREVLVPAGVGPGAQQVRERAGNWAARSTATPFMRPSCARTLWGA